MGERIARSVGGGGLYHMGEHSEVYGVMVRSVGGGGSMVVYYGGKGGEYTKLVSGIYITTHTY